MARSTADTFRWAGWGRFSEIGAAAAFLLSDTLSGYTTGAELVVDGGFRLRPMDLYSTDELRELNASGVSRVGLVYDGWPRMDAGTYKRVHEQVAGSSKG